MSTLSVDGSIVPFTVSVETTVYNGGTGAVNIGRITPDTPLQPGSTFTLAAGSYRAISVDKTIQRLFLLEGLVTASPTTLASPPTPSVNIQNGVWAAAQTYGPFQSQGWTGLMIDRSTVSGTFSVSIDQYLDAGLTMPIRQETRGKAGTVDLAWHTRLLGPWYTITVTPIGGTATGSLLACPTQSEVSQQFPATTDPFIAANGSIAAGSTVRPIGAIDWFGPVNIFAACAGPTWGVTVTLQRSGVDVHTIMRYGPSFNLLYPPGNTFMMMSGDIAILISNGDANPHTYVAYAAPILT